MRCEMCFTVDNVQPMRDEVLMKKSEVQLDALEGKFMLEDRNKKVNLFEVVRLGPDCKILKKGDVIGVEFQQHTVPIMIDGVLYAAVSEKDVWFVVEDDG